MEQAKPSDRHPALIGLALIFCAYPWVTAERYHRPSLPRVITFGIFGVSILIAGYTDIPRRIEGRKAKAGWRRGLRWAIAVYLLATVSGDFARYGGYGELLVYVVPMCLLACWPRMDVTNVPTAINALRLWGPIAMFAVAMYVVRFGQSRDFFITCAGIIPVIALALTIDARYVSVDRTTTWLGIGERVLLIAILAVGEGMALRVTAHPAEAPTWYGGLVAGAIAAGFVAMALAALAPVTDAETTATRVPATDPFKPRPAPKSTSARRGAG